MELLLLHQMKAKLIIKHIRTLYYHRRRWILQTSLYAPNFHTWEEISSRIHKDPKQGKPYEEHKLQYVILEIHWSFRKVRNNYLKHVRAYGLYYHLLILYFYGQPLLKFALFLYGLCVSNHLSSSIISTKSWIVLYRGKIDPKHQHGPRSTTLLYHMFRFPSHKISETNIRHVINVPFCDK